MYIWVDVYKGRLKYRPSPSLAIPQDEWQEYLGSRAGSFSFHSSFPRKRESRGPTAYNTTTGSRALDSRFRGNDGNFVIRTGKLKDPGFAGTAELLGREILHSPRQSFTNERWTHAEISARPR